MGKTAIVKIPANIENKKELNQMDIASHRTVMAGGARSVLKDTLPLDTPYLVQMFPSYACNFRCGFCLHALDKSQHGYISNVPFMDMELYRKCIDDMRNFPRKIKMLRFAAWGEPLLHKQIAEMVAYAKKSEIAESVDIVTNGYLLTHKMSDQLIDAGLDRLRISVEGLSAEDYLEHTGTVIDFERFLEQLRYFYEHSKNTEIYLKIIDYMIQEPTQQRLFYEMFRPICHTIAVTHLTPTVPEINYSLLAGGMPVNKPQNADTLQQTKICPQGFYMMQINPDGKVVPCCAVRYPMILGDAGKEAVPDIWNGERFNRFRFDMLHSLEQASPVCGDCQDYPYAIYAEDVLDDAAERLKNAYKGVVK